MRKFIVQVNGVQYDVEIEEIGGACAPAAMPAAQSAPARPRRLKALRQPLPPAFLRLKALLLRQLPLKARPRRPRAWAERQSRRLCPARCWI